MPLRFVILTLVLLTAACKKPPGSPDLSRASLDKGVCTNCPNDENGLPISVSAAARIWPLTPKQFGNTLDGILGKAVGYEKKGFPLDKRSGSFGNGAGDLALDSGYVTTMTSALTAILKESMPELSRYLPCGSVDKINEQCLDGFVTQFGAKAFRRPLITAERELYTNLYQTLKTASVNDSDSLQTVAEAILRSPNAQFRSEISEKLNAYEIASAIAYSLTNGPPDEILLKAAAAGTLGSSAGIEKEVKRIMQTDLFVSGFSDFISHWTGAYWIDEAKQSAPIYPDMNPALKDAMKSDFEDFIRVLLREKNASFKAMLTANDFTISPSLAKIYGVPAFKDKQKLPDAVAGQRGGIFMTAASLVANSKETETGPIHRGYAIVQRLLCQNLPAAPNIPPDDPKLVPEKETTRQRDERRTGSGDCKTCHQMMNPFGFGFENFNAIGAYQAQEKGMPIDASGTVNLPGANKLTFKDGVEMFKGLSENESVHECFAKQAFRYVFGRGESASDEALLKTATSAFKTSNYDMTTLLLAFYKSDYFINRTVPSP